MRLTPPPLSTGRAFVYGALTVATLDILDAFVFFGFRGVPPVTILQSIASGLLGSAAYEGGAATAVLGLMLHVFIASGVVGTYLVASRFVPALVRHPVLGGLLYGLAVYLVMYRVVLPLSAIGARPRPWPVVTNGVLIHLLGIGLPSAWFAWAAMRERVTR